MPLHLFCIRRCDTRLSCLTRSRREYIDPGPDFGGWPFPQMIVWAIMVVPGANLAQRQREVFAIHNGFSRQFPLHCSDESFDPSVLPGATRLDALLANAEQPQTKSKHTRHQHRFIVRTQELWSAIPLHGLSQFLQQRPG